MADADRHLVQSVLTVRRWRRYGADLIFVTAATGRPLGSVDLTSGQVHVHDGEPEAPVRRAVQEYLRSDADEVMVPHQRPPIDGLSVQDAELLTQWLGTPILLGGPAPSETGDCLGSRLDRLGDLGWGVLHSVPVGLQGAVCAHLLIGPGGVCVVRELGQPGQRITVDGNTVRVDGERSTVLRDVELEAARVRAILLGAGAHRVVTRPVVAVTGDLEISDRQRVPGPLVVPVSGVAAAVQALPEVLTPLERLGLNRIAHRDTTWLI